MDDPLAWINAELKTLEKSNLLRQLRTREGPQAAKLQMESREYVNFGSNDYLGLASDQRLTTAAAQAMEVEGWGSGASPLLVGRSESHERLERRLAEFEGVEAALCFNAGFAGNLGVISALTGAGDIIHSDALNHASIVDGCRLSRAELCVYPHANVTALAKMLAKASGYRRRLIVTDSVFSMDGDLAPLIELGELAQRHRCMLMIDEAHATGVFGARGRGVAEHFGCEELVHVRVGTLSKALGGAGGFVAGGQPLIDWLANRARPYVFSTAMPPAAARAAIAALDIVRDEPWRRQRLLARASELKVRLETQGWNVGSAQSQILPIVIGDAAETLAIAAALARRGFWVPAIRPPSTPAGQSRLRISLSSSHDDAMIEGLVESLGQIAEDRQASVQQ